MSKINETNYPRRTQANYADTDMLVIQAAGGNTYTTRLEDMREDYEETLAPTLSALQDDVNENLATIEAGSTASQAYAKGDFLVFGGRLCKAKTSIAVNATLVLDTNIELASVGGELSSISSDLASLIKITIDSASRSNNDAPSTYPLGLTMTTTGVSTDFPFIYSTVFTLKSDNNRGIQITANATGSALKFRVVDSANAWYAWHDVSVT